MAQILLKEGVAQPTPPSDTLAIYAKTDNKLYIKNPAGVETLISGSEASGTVTTVSVNSANGFTGTVTNPTTTPAITVATNITGIIKGNGTSISAATSGTDYAPATSGTSILYGNGSGGFSNVTIGSNLSFIGGTLSATGGGSSTWGSITGTLSSQTDLQSALNAKANTSHTHALSDITQSGATSGQVPTWNGSAWAPADPSGGAGGSLIFEDDFIGGGITSFDIGQLGWSLTAASSVNTYTPEDNHPGVWGISYNSTSYGFASVGQGSNTPSFTFGSLDYVEFIIKMGESLTTSQYLWCGIAGAGNNPLVSAPVHGAYLQLHAYTTNAVMYTYNATTGGSKGTLSTFVPANWQRIKIRRVTTGQVAFSLNGGTETIISTNVPDDTDGMAVFIQIGNGSTATTHYIDYFKLVLKAPTR